MKGNRRVDISVGKKKITCLVDNDGRYVRGSVRDESSRVATKKSHDDGSETAILADKFDMECDLS